MVETAESLRLNERDYNHEARLYDDTTTWLAEVLDGQMHTEFDYTFNGHELYGRDNGALKPIFETALKDAERLTKHNPNLAFELRRRRIEMAEYKEMIAMAKGERPNTIVVVSDFPPELMNSSTDVGGYNARRKQTMLRVITRGEDGNIRMQSQSLDRSDRKSLEAIYKYLGFEPQPGELLGQRMNLELPAEEQEFLSDWLVGVYDRKLSSQYGNEWYAGRTPAEILNTYDFVRSQRDLIDTFVWHQLNSSEKAENLRYGVAAAMEKRFKARFRRENYIPNRHQAVLQEIHGAGIIARQLGITYSGCGMTLEANQQQALTQNELNELGYGNKSNTETKYKFDQEMHCVVCQKKPRPDEPKKMCGPCGICEGCDIKIRKRNLN